MEMEAPSDGLLVLVIINFIYDCDHLFLEVYSKSPTEVMLFNLEENGEGTPHDAYCNWLASN